MAYYDYRVFGSAFTPPYKINRQTYAVAQHFLWQSPRPEPVYRHRIMRDFYAGPEAVGDEVVPRRDWLRSRASEGQRHQGACRPGFLSQFRADSAARYAPLGSPRTPHRIFDRNGHRCRRRAGGRDLLRTALPRACHGAPLCPSAPVHASSSACAGHPGLFLVRATPVLCLALAVLRIFAQPLHIDIGPERSIPSHGMARRRLDSIALGFYRNSKACPVHSSRLSPMLLITC